MHLIHLSCVCVLVLLLSIYIHLLVKNIQLLFKQLYICVFSQIPTAIQLNFFFQTIDGYVGMPWNIQIILYSIMVLQLVLINSCYTKN